MSADLERAELYLCLARSFLPPAGEAAFAALRDALMDDLDALCTKPDCTDLIGDLRTALASVADGDALSRLYSKLFLAPPRRVHINAGAYLDGGLMGRSVQALEACYGRAGVERREDFRSSSDHVSVQLEFAAYLYSRAPGAPLAGQFLDMFVVHWLPGFVSDLERAATEVGPNPYLALARVLARAVTRDAVSAPQEPKLARKQRALERARTKRAARGVTPADLVEIERRLKERGLSIEHLPRAAG